MRCTGARSVPGDGHHAPAYRLALTCCVDQVERVNAVIALGRVTGRRPGRLHPFQEGRGFRVRGEKCRCGGRIRFASRGIGGLHLLQLKEGFRRPHREHRHAVHARAPLLAVGLGETQRQAADRHTAVRGVGVTTGQRKTPNHRRPCRAEDLRSGILTRLSGVFEVTDHAHPFGVIASKAWVNTVVGLQHIDQRLGGQTLWVQCAIDVGKGPGQGRNHHADPRQAQDQAPRAQGYFVGWRCMINHKRLQGRSGPVGRINQTKALPVYSIGMVFIFPRLE
ncbi:hypothetical protein D3C78_1132940 [compost metagenome]